VNQDVARLEELLVRVQHNAALPRTVVAAKAAVSFAASPSAPVAAAAPAPVSFAAPPSAPAAAAAPVHVPPPAAYTPEAPPAFTPEPATFAQHEAAPVAAAASASLDASVDDLLLEDPFPSARMPAAPAYTGALEEEPMPQVAAAQPTEHDDVSGVMVVAGLSEEAPEELLEDDIVEMTSSTEAAATTAVHDPLGDLNFDDDELDADQGAAIEEPPASSSRSKIAGTMDEALARAAEQVQLEEGREVPLKTPPPESGPQEAMALPAGIHAPLAPDIEELLEADIQPKGGVNAALPTAEQLGQTIDLEEARGPSLELDHPPAFQAEPAPAASPNEELEVTLPQREYGGGYQDDLMPPPEARQELDAHRQRFGEEELAPPPESLAQYPYPSQQDVPSAGFAPVIVPSSVSTDSYSESVSMVTVDAPANAEFAPELLARPELNPGPVAKFVRVEAPRPRTFLELLDTSLGLGRG